MPKDFYIRLKGYFMKVGEVLRGEAESASIFPNTTDIGMSRERIYARFLQAHLPANCVVLFGGFLFNIDGQESKQVDLIVVNNSSPQFNFHAIDGHGKSFACIDGALAVASIKSNLTSSELVDALENIASLPDKQPLGSRKMPIFNMSNYDDWPYKIIYAQRGISLNTLLGTLEEFYKANPTIPFTKRPNLIHVGGMYNIERIGECGGETRDGTKIPPHVFYPQPDSTDVVALTRAVMSIQKNAMASQFILFGYDEIINHIPLR